MVACIEFRDTYKEANVNGVDFIATDLSDQFGRRGPVHEYPDRDTPAAEDLGRSARRYSVSGYINGPDHVAQAERLRRAVERVSPARLTHPIWGRLTVKIDSCTISHNVENAQRESKIQITAVEFGGLSFPSSIFGIGSLVQTAIDAFFGVSASAFGDIFSLSGLTTGGSSQSLAAVSDVAQTLIDEYTATITDWDDETTQILANLQSMQSYPQGSVVNINQIIAETMESIADSSSTDAALASFENLMSYGAGSYSTTGPNAQQVSNNISALISVVRTNAAAYATVAALDSINGNIGYQYANDLLTIPSPTDRFLSASDALQFMDRVCGIIEQEIAIAQATCNDDMVSSLMELQAQTIKELMAVAYDLPSRIVVDTCQPLPSLVAAFRATGDSRRVLEIECANPGRSAWFVRSQVETRSSIQG